MRLDGDVKAVGGGGNGEGLDSIEDKIHQESKRGISNLRIGRDIELVVGISEILFYPRHRFRSA